VAPSGWRGARQERVLTADGAAGPRRGGKEVGWGRKGGRKGSGQIGGK
jgi:hypothetical protein